VCLGGHWKRIEVMLPQRSGGQQGWLGWNIENEHFQKNRADVVSRCIERGINYIDACIGAEVMAYSKALKGRRDKMYLGFSWSEGEMRGLGSQPIRPTSKASPCRPVDHAKLKDVFDHGPAGLNTSICGGSPATRELPPTATRRWTR
jgi:hypothetical protein